LDSFRVLAEGRYPSPIKEVKVHAREAAEPLKFAEYRIALVPLVPCLIEQLSLFVRQFWINQKRDIEIALRGGSTARTGIDEQDSLYW
jgi:hypothetical protein